MVNELVKARILKISAVATGATLSNRMVLRLVEAANLTEEDTLSIKSSLDSLGEIEALVQSGKLTDEEAITQFEGIIETMPNPPKPSLEGFLESWKEETEILLKTIFAKEIQEMVGAESDGLIGGKTIAAIRAEGIETEIRIPTLEENKKFRTVMEIAEEIESGKITEEVGFVHIKKLLVDCWKPGKQNLIFWRKQNWRRKFRKW